MDFRWLEVRSEKRGMGTAVETGGIYVPGMLAGTKIRSFRLTGTKEENRLWWILNGKAWDSHFILLAIGKH